MKFFTALFTGVLSLTLSAQISIALPDNPTASEKMAAQELAEHFNMSRAQFKYAFYKEYGKSDIKGTISRYLIELAQRELLYSDKPLFRIAEQLHFSSIYAFSRFFKQHCGVSPLTFRKQQGQE